jgi:ATP-dependent DNA helicase RecQ
MIQYSQSATCRWKLLLEYFGEPVDSEGCGTCDNCQMPMEERIASTA